MGFCLPKDDTQKLLTAVHDGSFDFDKYAEQPSTEARRAYLEDFVGKDNAKEVNTHLEQKMLLKDWQRGMVTAIKKMTGLSEPAKRSFVDRINNMREMLTPTDEKNFYADITEHKLGVAVTDEEAGKIADLAKTAQEAKEAPTDNPSGVSAEYLKASGDLRAYVESLKPKSALAQIFKNLITTGRNFMLMNPSTPLKTLAGQFENSALDMVTRRIANMSAKGMAGSAAKDINAQAWKTFRETGLNTLSMSSLDDTGKLGENHNFDIPSGGAKGLAVKATGLAAKWTNKIAIDWEHNYFFTKFHQKAWTDAANIAASKIASDEGAGAARAEEIIRDAARIQPQTEAGKMVRDSAQFNAARVTGTADTWASKASMDVVQRINDTVPGLGNFLFSIVKIPTNIIVYGAENAGGGLLTGPIDMIKGRELMQSADLATKYQGTAQFAKGFQTLARTVGVMTASWMVANQLQKADFKNDRYGSSYVKIGGTWVNMEYFYAISPSLAGFMEVKKGGAKNPEEAGAKYVAGVGNTLRRLPIVDNANQIITDMSNPNPSKGINKYFTSLAAERTQPAFLTHLEKGEGIKSIFFGTTGLPTNAELKKVGAK